MLHCDWYVITFFILEYKYQLTLLELSLYDSCDTGNRMVSFFSIMNLNHLLMQSCLFELQPLLCVFSFSFEMLLYFSPDFSRYPDVYGQRNPMCYRSSSLCLIFSDAAVSVVNLNWRYPILNSVWRLIPEQSQPTCRTRSCSCVCDRKSFPCTHQDGFELLDWGGAGDDPVRSEERRWAKT